MKKVSKLIAIMAMICLVAGMLFSYDYIIENAHHHCSGEDCPICMEIEAAVHFVSSLRVILMLSFVMAVLCVFTRVVTSVGNHAGVKQTLITLKVELLN